MRKQRKYAPFVKQGKRWIRATYQVESVREPGLMLTFEYTPHTKQSAIVRYQSWLLAPFLNGINEIRELRPVKE